MKQNMLKSKVGKAGKAGKNGGSAVSPRVHQKKRPDVEKEEEEEELEEEVLVTDQATDVQDDEHSSSEQADGASDDDADENATFADLGLAEVLCEACATLKFTKPTEIQRRSIPLALQGKDVIGLAETGSGKTAAFALPVLHDLLATKGKKEFFALVLAPTRELAFQIRQTFNALGSPIGLKSAVLVGGIDMTTQAIALAKKPHVLIATPGRLVDHLENTKGFHLKALRYLIMDEADRMLNMDYEKELDKILAVIPRERRTFLFSATMTSKVGKLQRASLRDPVKVEVNSKYKTVDTLIQRYMFVPQKFKDCYLIYLMNQLRGNSFIIFCSTCNNVMKATLVLRDLGFDAVCLHGQMSQPKRLGALAKFTSQSHTILVATDVASRGLDIPHVDVVVNYDIPTHSKDYIHRVGRTARAGRSGHAITIATQYDVELFQRIEALIGKKMEEYPTESSQVLQLLERVSDAQRNAINEMKELNDNKRGARGGGGGSGGARGKKPKRSSAH
ncbi:uncharacterized protein MONBRDRAFT_37739 [Monosiga brevicollis MX1]|uniref:RNA helicase n=1 Tax=Monosiga brevicollis TaxID=81824 RepID=A9V3R8_MONBE|nr:uncharacterized protein MONBRDRAFT_37739 [Monosiga brevicollis MX1]EDQ87858.1 predicted protein [Monosiga brevicollis MX1]|eukprot:XP_001747391.1 hypothetical protein [Monosiga brevicollis MX1]